MKCSSVPCLLLFSVVLSLLVVSPTTAFVATTKSKSPPLLQEALDCFPFEFRPENERPGAKGRPKFACSKSQATQTFQELSKLYGGDDNALKIIQTQPLVLTFDSNNFKPCLEAWERQFGLEKARAMVLRNPGLLAVSPVLAREPAEATMALSYVIAATRPLPKIIAVAGILAIATAGMR
jgi:hypothetical protein